MAYCEITILTSREEAETLAEALEELDALAVTLEDSADDPLFQLQPQEMPLWECVSVKALFPDNIKPEKVLQSLTSLLDLSAPLSYQSQIIADQDWVRLTQQQFSPQCYANHLWICPSWHKEPLTGSIVYLDPGLAFGTGTHPTTSLCLDWLAHHSLKNKVVIDYGCGSGILSLAAVVLGAASVHAVDHDEQALLATHNNAALNTTINTDCLTICYPEALPAVAADVIIANILSGPLITLAPTFQALLKPGGTLVLSGLLEHEIPTVLAAYRDHFTIDDIAVQEQWVRIAARKSS